MATQLDYEKLQSSPHVTVFGAPSGTATGIQETAVPTAPEINNTGGTSGMLNWSPSISWNDYGFAQEASETINDPSFADESTYEEFGARNYGGEISFYYPQDYDDNSNNHSLVYDMTDTPRTLLDVVVRIDGEKRTTVPAADGDIVHVFRTMTDSEANVLTQPDAFRRTVGFLNQGDAEFYTIVGTHTITTSLGTTPWAAGKKARIQAIVQDRDYTNALSYTSSDAEVVAVYPGGFYEVTGTSADTATITVRDRAAGTSTTITVTVT